MDIKATDCITVVGQRGCGKSHLAREINNLFPRSLIIDPAYDWIEGEKVNSFDQLTTKLINKKNNNDKKFKLIFQFNPDQGNKDAYFNHILRLCYHFGNLQVVIDEVQLFTNPHYLPEYFKNLLFIGRHKGVSIMAITQRPAQLNKSILSQSSHVFVGQLHEKNDLRSVADFLNEDTDKLIQMPKRHFLYFSPENGKKIITTENNKNNKNIKKIQK